MDHLKAIQILAAHAVKKGTFEYFERYVLRWFSKTFHTPYPVVKEMEFEEVLQAFWEDHYAQLDEEKFDLELRELLETPAERAARIKAEEDEELAMQRLAAESEIQNKKMEQVVQPGNVPALPQELKETTLPENLKELIKPDVEMKFVSEDDLNRLIESIDALNEMKKP